MNLYRVQFDLKGNIGADYISAMSREEAAETFRSHSPGIEIDSITIIQKKGVDSTQA